MARILVVDDHFVNREFLSVLLGYAGHNVLSANDGVAALEMARAELPDLIISDVSMPVMNGVELANAIHADQTTALIPVLFYTATYKVTEARALAETCGVKTVLAKPANPQLLLDTVAEALGVSERVPGVDEGGGGELAALLPVHLNELSDLQLRLKDCVERGFQLLNRDGGNRRVPQQMNTALAAVQHLCMRLSTLLELALTLLSEREPGELLSLFCRAAQDIMDRPFVAVGLLDSDGRVLSQWQAYGLPEEVVAELPLVDAQSGFFAEVLLTNKPNLVFIEGAPAEIGLPVNHPPVHAVLAVPVKSATSIAGVLYFADRDANAAFDEEDEVFAVMLATQLVLAYSNLVQHQEIQKHAVTLEIALHERIRQAIGIARLSRLYAVLSGVNSLIVRSRDRDTLFQELCRVSVVEGGFSAVWVTMIGPDAEAGRIVASLGAPAEYLVAFTVTRDGNGAGGQLPGSVALQGGEPAICNNCQTNPAFAALRNGMRELKHASMAAFPIGTGHDITGVVSFLSEELDFFDSQELKLLRELAGDVSFSLEHIASQERLQHSLLYDALTNLPNTTLFLERLGPFVANARSAGEIAALSTIDIQDFTHINAVHGRDVGDIILRAVAARLSAVIEDSNRIARCGSDQFCVALSASSPEAASLAIEELLEQLSRPFDGIDVHVAVHCGVALFPADAPDADALFRCAEAALAQAKAQSERTLYYSPGFNRQIAVRRTLEVELRSALKNEEFAVYFQPRINLATGALEAAEALVRWNSPQKGLVPPAHFIPLAEETGLIVPLGEWVIDAVCRQQRHWSAGGLKPCPVAINVSARQLYGQDLEAQIARSLRQFDIAPDLIQLELTETAIMADARRASGILERIHAAGIAIALDDFGTGYSSLAYLRTFPFKWVKVDRSFVADIGRNDEAGAIVSTVIAMAHRLGLKVVAEGVETVAQMAYLHDQRCDEMQGYLFSRPLPAEAFSGLLRGGESGAFSPLRQKGRCGLLFAGAESGYFEEVGHRLRAEGYHVRFAGTVAEGLRFLLQQEVGVVVADLGRETAGFLRALKDVYPGTVALALLASITHADIEELVNGGLVQKVVAKPCDADLLRARIVDCLGPVSSS